MVLLLCTREIFKCERLFLYLLILLSNVAEQILKPRLVNVLWWRGRSPLCQMLEICLDFYFQFFWNQLITLAVFFHSFTFNISHSLEFIWSKICLLILPISFLVGLMILVVGWFKKVSLWSFKVKKKLDVSFTSTLSNIFASLVYLIPSQLILLSASLLDFLYVVVTAFCNRRRYSSFSSRYLFYVLSAKVNVFFDERTFLKSSCNFIWKSFLTLRNLIFFTKSMRSFSNGINSLSCPEHLLLFKPYAEPLAQDSVVSLLLFMKKISFHRNLFMNNLIFSISCSL